MRLNEIPNSFMLLHGILIISAGSPRAVRVFPFYQLASYNYSRGSILTVVVKIISFSLVKSIYIILISYYMCYMYRSKYYTEIL